MFFVMLMPGPELDSPRLQAEEFQRLFARQLEQSRGLRADNQVAFNRSTIDLAKRFSDYKKAMREQQASGKMRSLVWPLFFQHTAREADVSRRGSSCTTGARSSSTERRSSTSVRRRWASTPRSSLTCSTPTSGC